MPMMLDVAASHSPEAVISSRIKASIPDSMPSSRPASPRANASKNLRTAMRPASLSGARSSDRLTRGSMSYRAIKSAIGVTVGAGGGGGGAGARFATGAAAGGGGSDPHATSPSDTAVSAVRLARSRNIRVVERRIRLVMAGDLHGFVDSAEKPLEHLAGGQFMDSRPIRFRKLRNRTDEIQTVR